jgi:hypothetical protein
MPDEDRIIRKLNEVRRRQFLVCFVNTAGIALVVWVLGFVLCRFGFFALPKPSFKVDLAAGIALAGAAFLFSVLTMPSRKETAKLVDRALGLKQRVETSLESIPAHDEMDALLLQDTGRRMAAIRPAEIVPAQINRAVTASFLVCLLAISAFGIARILQRRNLLRLENNGNRIQTAKGSLAKAKTLPKTEQEGSRTNNPAKMQPSMIAGSEAGRPLLKESVAVPEPADPSGLQSAQGPPAVPIPDRGAADNRNLTAAAAIFAKSQIMPEPEKGSTNRQSAKPGETAEGNKMSGRERASGRNPPVQPNAGAASIRKAERGGNGQAGASAHGGTQENPGGALPAGRTGLLSPKPIQSGSNAVSPADPLLNYPALLPAAERALAKEKMPPGLKSYIAEYFKAIHP